uniref:G_PROTEIN_RECEP_F3_4 domain-containing protein n=1 Tax=Macrostomum lignano TaxID=282301 RepID=A0A1I8IN37_9PLAT
IPQISYASTSPELSDVNRFDYFFRVVPSDIDQAKAMAAIVRRMGWDYVAALHDGGTYGERGIQEFKTHASNQGVCISKVLIIPRNPKNGSLNLIVESLLNLPKSRVVVAFCQSESLRSLFRLLNQQQQLQSGLTQQNRLFWVASDGWGRKTDHLVGNEAMFEGAISLLPERRVVDGFDAYFKSLTLEHRRLNPWWSEFWATHFQCRLGPYNPAASKDCTGRERIGVNSRYEQEGLVPMVLDAVQAMSRAIEDMHNSLCKNVTLSKCRWLNSTINGTQLRDFIRSVNFSGTSGNPVRFNMFGDRESQYEVFQYQRIRSGAEGSSGGFRYVKIGIWNNQLELVNSSIRWGTKNEAVPRSVCSEPCHYGYRTVVLNKEAATCCWDCVACDKYQVVINSSLCSDCQPGYVPNRFYNACQELPVDTIRLTSVWAVLPMGFSLVGLAWTAFVLTVFIRYNQTPLIRASGRELCYVMLAGILMSYCMTFIMLAPPTPFTCGVLRIFNGLSLSIVYSAIFTKTNRLSRIFNRGIKSLMKKPSYTSPKSQLILCSCLVSVQVIGDITWLGMDLPKTKFDYPDRDHKVLRCAVDDVAIVVSLLYNMILIVLCTLYAFKTRNIPENFNEAKYIAFTMYSTCIVWLAFIAIYFGSLRNFRIKLTSLCMCISISASVTLCCMFAPRSTSCCFNRIKMFTPNSTVGAGAVSGGCGPSGGGGGGARELFSSPSTRQPLIRRATSVPPELTSPSPSPRLSKFSLADNAKSDEVRQPARLMAVSSTGSVSVTVEATEYANRGGVRWFQMVPSRQNVIQGQLNSSVAVLIANAPADPDLNNSSPTSPQPASKWPAARKHTTAAAATAEAPASEEIGIKEPPVWLTVEQLNRLEEARKSAPSQPCSSCGCDDHQAEDCQLPGEIFANPNYIRIELAKVHDGVINFACGNKLVMHADTLLCGCFGRRSRFSPGGASERSRRRQNSRRPMTLIDEDLMRQEPTVEVRLNKDDQQQQQQQLAASVAVKSMSLPSRLVDTGAGGYEAHGTTSDQQQQQQQPTNETAAVVEDPQPQ